MKGEHGGEGCSRQKDTQGTVDRAASEGVFKPLAHRSNEGWIQQDTVYRGWTQTSGGKQDVLPETSGGEQDVLPETSREEQDVLPEMDRGGGKDP